MAGRVGPDVSGIELEPRDPQLTDRRGQGRGAPEPAVRQAGIPAQDGAQQQEGVAAAEAWGLHELGNGAGTPISSRPTPLNSSGRRPA